MNHLPRPREAIDLRFSVPLLRALPHDLSDFRTFPGRNGFVLEDGLDLRHNPEDLAVLMQSWLYFGFIASLTNIQKNPRAGVVSDLRRAFTAERDEMLVDTTEGDVTEPTRVLGITTSLAGRMAAALEGRRHACLRIYTTRREGSS